jgi:hypothetical protein
VFALFVCVCVCVCVCVGGDSSTSVTRAGWPPCEAPLEPTSSNGTSGHLGRTHTHTKPDRKSAMSQCLTLLPGCQALGGGRAAWNTHLLTQDRTQVGSQSLGASSLFHLPTTDSLVSLPPSSGWFFSSCLFHQLASQRLSKASLEGLPSPSRLNNIRKFLYSRPVLLKDMSLSCLLGVRPGHKLLAIQGWP